MKYAYDYEHMFSRPYSYSIGVPSSKSNRRRSTRICENGIIFMLPRYSVCALDMVQLAYYSVSRKYLGVCWSKLERLDVVCRC